MKRTFLSAVCLMLSLVMLALAAVSCSENGQDGNTEAATTASVEVNSDEVTEKDIFDGVNFKGEKFTYLVWKQGVIEYYGSEEEGDMISSAVFHRNELVQNKLGVEFEYIELPGNSSTFKDFCTTATNNISVGNKEYDAIGCYTRAASLLMISNVLENLLDVDYLNFDNAWWPASLTQLNTIGGKLYFASGDIATSLLYEMMFLCVNKDLAHNLQIDTDVQQLALDGGWTLDTLLQLTQGRYIDLDADHARSTGDQYGLYSITHPMLDVFYLGAGLKYVDINNEGEAMISESYFSDPSLDILDKLKRLYWQGDEADGYFSTTGGNATAISNGLSLFYVIDGNYCEKYLRQADFSYGILCAPKYTAEQKNYYTAVGFPHSMYCIPSDAPNTEMSGAVLELMGRESHNEVTPVVFDTSFKYKFGKDMTDANMFEIIRSGVVFDLGRTLFDQLGGDTDGPVRIWRNEIVNNSNTFAARKKALAGVWDTRLASTIEEIKNAD